ncbi:hypothetical protein RchiOBHm_Chr1g0354611 [Rosa chinensis]|uniref:Uncharacterized protein n=1 Tax=Rosa chinensis TaxID=74649 RepID=A0A2P6SH50_ROSCH|nr:hypothetical protein RchiOBHm_Chr1g0354611 [Rosa chinensis]
MPPSHALHHGARRWRLVLQNHTLMAKKHVKDNPPAALSVRRLGSAMESIVASAAQKPPEPSSASISSPISSPPSSKSQGPFAYANKIELFVDNWIEVLFLCSFCYGKWI